MQPQVFETHELRAATDRRPRLDQYLREKLPWRSRSRLQEFLAQGHITVNGGAVKPSYRIKRGDCIILNLPAAPMPALAFAPGQIPAPYIDRHLAVINKPAGMLTHQIAGHQHDTLMNYIRLTYGASHGTPHTCHRLDRDTSGAILVAFDAMVMRLLQRQFERHEVRKSYLALVAGDVSADLTSIELPIRAGVDLPSSLAGEHLKESRTLVARVAARNGYTLVRASPITGRQNQIRIHLAAHGHPLAGDWRFGGPPAPPEAPHFLLHAERLRFFHPLLHVRADIAVPLPGVFRDTLRALELEDVPEQYACQPPPP